MYISFDTMRKLKYMASRRRMDARDLLSDLVDAEFQKQELVDSRERQEAIYRMEHGQGLFSGGGV